MNIKNIFLGTVWALIALTACSSDDKPVYPEPPVYDMSGFAKGADVSWLTEMERSRIKFDNRAPVPNFWPISWQSVLI